jgi:predicted RNA-binding Zn ribbon-like protein
VTEPAGEHAFDLSGGSLCLDFANTVSDRGSDHPVEHLRRWADLVAWGRQAGALDDGQAASLARRGEARPREAAALLDQALALREAIFATFAAVAAGREPPAAAVAVLNAHLPRALSHLQLSPAREGLVLDWEEDPAALDRLLWPVAWGAARLLTSEDRGAVRECAASDCRWLFLDRSRNHSRRWCDMKACGNRAKARRHYRRQHRQA